MCVTDGVEGGGGGWGRGRAFTKATAAVTFHGPVRFVALAGDGGICGEGVDNNLRRI